MIPLSAGQLLQSITNSNSKFGKLIKYAKTQGMSDEEIAAYLSGDQLQGATTTQQGEFNRKKKTAKNLTNVLDFIKAGAKVAALGAGAYGLYRAGQAAYGAFQGAGGLGGLMGGNQPTNPNPPPNTPGSPQVPQGTAQAQQQPQRPTLRQQIIAANTPTTLQNVASAVQTAAPFIPGTAGKAIGAAAGLASSFLGQSQPQSLAQSFLEQRKELAGKTQGAALTALEQESEEAEALEGRVTKDLDTDLKSAVIRRSVYNPKTKRLRVIFNNDATYVYSDVPEDIAKKFLEGGVAAKTSGKNQYGAWWVGKDPSVGAAFNKLIKEPGYAYEKVGSTRASVDEKKEYAKLSQGNEKKASKVKSLQVALKKLTDLNELKGLPRKERNEKIIEWVESRLKEGKTSDKMSSKSAIKKLLTLLPVSIVKQLKNKIDKVDEKDILTFVKEYLTKSK